MPNVKIDPNDIAIRLKGLKKSFGPQNVLCDVNLDIRRGETMVIIGKSGGGKSVILKHMIGLLQPDGGEVTVDGVTISTPKFFDTHTIRRKMGMLFQMGALFDSMTVLENVMFPLDMFSNDTLRDRIRRARFCLDRVNLLEAQDKYPGEISGGMQKRVSFARAIVTNPKTILYDEPTAGLDPISSTLIEDYIVRLKEETIQSVASPEESKSD